MSLFGYRPWQDNHEKRLQLEFEAICWHEAGHFGAGVEHARDALKNIAVYTHKQLSMFEGRTGVDLRAVREGRVAPIALAGCMAEARADALTKRGFRFMPQQWLRSLKYLRAIANAVDPNALDRLLPISFDFETDEDDCLGLANITAADIYYIPDGELTNPDHMRAAFRVIARMLDDDKNWACITRLAKHLMTHPDQELTPDQALRIYQGG